MKAFTQKGLNCHCTTLKDASQIIYILAPVEVPTDKILSWAQQCHCNIAVIYGMDWNNDLSPWPANGIPAGSPNFNGLAPDFLKHLQVEVIPTIEKALGYTAAPSRILAGISLSGLFALWAWMQDDYFSNICSISGSFWYPGFVDWLKRTTIPAKTASPYFSLGEKESQCTNPIFSSVADCTNQVVETLLSAGIDAQLIMDSGDHFASLEPRLDQMFRHIESTKEKIPA